MDKYFYKFHESKQLQFFVDIIYTDSYYLGFLLLQLLNLIMLDLFHNSLVVVFKFSLQQVKLNILDV